MNAFRNGKDVKVLMLNYEFPPLGGGAGNANYYLLKEFSNQPGITIDLVQGNGFVVAKGSSEELRKAIGKYIGSYKLIGEHGNKSREIACENSWHEVARQYADIYFD